MVRRFISYYKPHRRLFIIDMIAAAIMSGFDLFLPFVTKNFIDNYIPNKNVQMMVKTSIFLLFIYILRIFMQIIVNYWGHIMGTRVEHDMRRDLFEKIESLDFSFFNKHKTGEIMSRIVGDLRDVAEMAHHVPEDIFISIVMLIGAMIFLFSASIQLGLVVVAFIVIFLLYSARMRLNMFRGFRLVRQKHAEINSQVESSIGGIRLTQSFTNEAYECKKFADSNANYRDSWRIAYRALTAFHTGSDFIINIFYLAILVFGGYLVYHNEMTAGMLASSLLFVNFVIQPIRRLINSLQMVQNGFAGIERFHEIMELEPKIQNPKAPVILENPKGVIEFKNVSFKYDEKGQEILKDFNLRIEAGKQIALVGHTGVGKSTISYLIPRFYDVTEGEVLVDGINVKDYDIYSLRQAIGHVQQDVYIFYGTIKENILYGHPHASDEEVIEAAKRARLHDFVMSLENGYDTIVGERGANLSGGQKQRISIARVFLKNPPILILDEATSALDNITEREIQAALEELAKGRTTIVIAHRLSTIKNSDEIIVLDETGIIERGTHDQLIHSGGYYSTLHEAVQLV